MTLTEWKVKLTPAGILLLCYFIAPGLVQWFMGANDAVYGTLTFSALAQAALAVALVRNLFGLKQPLAAELTARLNGFGRPQAETHGLVEYITLAAGFVSILAFVLPPAGELLPDSRLITLLKAAALGYAGYLGYKIWKLAEPFMAYVPPAAPSEVPAAPPPPPPSERRCAKCGQLLETSAKICRFCKNPVQH